MTMVVTIPMVANKVAVDILDMLPTTKIENKKQNEGNAGMVAAGETLVTTILTPMETMGAVEIMIIPSTREEIDIPRTDEKNRDHQEADVPAGVDVAEGAEGSSNNNNANGRQHHHWTPIRLISHADTRTRILCG